MLTMAAQVIRTESMWMLTYKFRSTLKGLESRKTTGFDMRYLLIPLNTETQHFVEQIIFVDLLHGITYMKSIRA